MNFVEVIGYIAQLMFVSASFSQARKCYADGNAYGLSWGLLSQLVIGLVIMFYYVPVTIGLDYVLLSGYVGQLVCILFMIRYKIKPRLPVAELKGSELDQADTANDIDGRDWIWSEERGQYIEVVK